MKPQMTIIIKRLQPLLKMQRLPVVAMAFALIFFWAVPPVAAQDCALKEFASLNITTLPGGEIAVPLTIGGQSHMFVVQLTNNTSAISAALADALHLKPTHSTIPHTVFFGQVFTPTSPTPDFVSVPVSEGSAAINDFHLFVVNTTPGSGADGYLGVDFLRHFEVEIDFANGKLNLFSPNHCPGAVVYWPNTGAGYTLFGYTDTGNLIFPATVDGVRILTRLSTEPGNARMALEVAAKEFDISLRSDGLKAGGADDDGSMFYHYPFKSLQIGDVSIANPTIDLKISMNACDGKHLFSKKAVDMSMCSKDMGLIVGQNELRKLHLFFSFREGKLYVTTADSHK